MLSYEDDDYYYEEYTKDEILISIDILIENVDPKNLIYRDLVETAEVGSIVTLPFPSIDTMLEYEVLPNGNFVRKERIYMNCPNCGIRYKVIGDKSHFCH